MKENKSYFISVITLSLFLMALSVACAYIDNKVTTLYISGTEMPRKIDSLVKKIRSEEVVLTKDKIIPLLESIKQSDLAHNEFLWSNGKLWGKLSFALLVISLVQIACVVKVYFFENKKPNQSN